MKKMIYPIILLAALVMSSASFAQGYVVEKYRSGPAWSPQAKSAAVGAGAGAVIGALVSKNNRGSGALIGGLLGGGAGYLYGKHRAARYVEDDGTSYTHYRPYRNVSYHRTYRNSGYYHAYRPYRSYHHYRSYPVRYRKVVYVYKTRCR